MTFVVCPNLAIDRVLAVDAVRPGGLMRARILREQCGGKGSNVIRAITRLGGDGLLAGFAAGHTGDLLRDLAVAEGFPVRLIASEGETRISEVLLANDASVTRLYEQGPPISAAEEEALLAVAGSRPPAAGEWAVIDGAEPTGASPGFYGALCATLRTAGYRVLVDAAGEQLQDALCQGPECVKINLHEAREAAGVPEPAGDGDKKYAASPDELVGESLELCRRLRQAGAGDVVITFGEAGSAGLAGDRAYRVETPAVDAVNAVGSGDCYAGALVVCLERGEPVAAALAAAAGAAAANAADLITGHFTATLARDLAARTVVRDPAADPAARN